MGKRKKQKKKNGCENPTARIVLATAIAQLLTAFLDLIKKLLE